MKEGKKRGAERTQIATRDEEWSDERLKTFLSVEPPESLPADYNILLRAYRGMTAEVFARFLPFFNEAGKNINEKLENGSTFLDLVLQHRRSTPTPMRCVKTVQYPARIKRLAALSGAFFAHHPSDHHCAPVCRLSRESATGVKMRVALPARILPGGCSPVFDRAFLR